MAHFPDHMDPLEGRIINKLISKAFEKGYEIRVRDFEEPDDVFVDWTRDRAAIQKETAATCGTHYDVREGEGDKTWIGTILLIHGNGEDVISDAAWSSKRPESEALLEELMDHANA